MIQAITDDTFEQDVLTADGPVLVEFWATWCGPCVQVAKVLDQIAVERAGRLRIVKLNYDENPLVPTRYRVLGLPTMILFAGGEPVASIVGAKSKAALLRDIDAALDSLPVG
jgi:thioredoxin 1